MNSLLDARVRGLTSVAALVVALAIAASASSSAARGVVVEAAKLTSLGSTFDHKKGRAAQLPDGEDLAADLDLSDRACSAPDDRSGSSPATCVESYGVDRSFPVHRHLDANDQGNPLNGAVKKDYYVEFMKGCREMYAPDGFKCNGSEFERMQMNLRQPQSMFNFTTLGFAKVRAPDSIMKVVSKFWDQKFTSVDRISDEPWGPGNTYTNHWASPTKMISLSSRERKACWDGAKPVLEEWTGVELSKTSLYGVRVYTEGAVLAPHVDRMPLVISAIVNVAQRGMQEPWPLEVYGHDGMAYNITMDVGDMILYESHSVVHGRPFPLRGEYYANVFIHFEPLGHTLLYEEENAEDEESLASLYQQAWKKLKTKCSDDEECKERVDLNVADRVPHYVIPGSEEERRWVQTHPKARVDPSKDNEWVKGLNAHTAASSGDLDALIAIAEKNPEALKHRDSNGWNPLHEAVRGGHLDVVKFLLKGGLDKDERTHTGNGGSPLWWAKKTHGKKHPVVQYLESIGAKETPPDGHDPIK